jgi:hypothetical protein
MQHVAGSNLVVGSLLVWRALEVLSVRWACTLSLLCDGRGFSRTYYLVSRPVGRCRLEPSHCALQAVACTTFCGLKPCHVASLSRVSFGGRCCREWVLWVGSVWLSLLAAVVPWLCLKVGSGVGSYYLASGQVVLVLLRHGPNQFNQPSYGVHVCAS